MAAVRSQVAGNCRLNVNRLHVPQLYPSINFRQDLEWEFTHQKTEMMAGQVSFEPIKITPSESISELQPKVRGNRGTATSPMLHKNGVIDATKASHEYPMGPPTRRSEATARVTIERRKTDAVTAWIA